MDEQGRKERGETWRGLGWGGGGAGAGGGQAMARCILSTSGHGARQGHQSASTSVHMQTGSPPGTAPKKYKQIDPGQTEGGSTVFKQEDGSLKCY